MDRLQGLDGKEDELLDSRCNAGWRVHDGAASANVETALPVGPPREMSNFAFRFVAVREPAGQGKAP